MVVRSFSNTGQTGEPDDEPGLLLGDLRDLNFENCGESSPFKLQDWE